jgi:hypothetical protein
MDQLSIEEKKTVAIPVEIIRQQHADGETTTLVRVQCPQGRTVMLEECLNCPSCLDLQNPDPNGPSYVVCPAP